MVVVATALAAAVAFGGDVDTSTEEGAALAGADGAVAQAEKASEAYKKAVQAGSKEEVATAAKEARRAVAEGDKALAKLKKAIEKLDEGDRKTEFNKKLGELYYRLHPEDLEAFVTPPAGATALAALASSGRLTVDVAGTGETIGHIADLKIQNLTDQPLTCAIPPTILESGSGKNQDYACPRGQTVALNPHETKTVPMNGVCLNRNKPPVGKGVSGDLVMNEANPSGPQSPNSHLPATDANKLLRICTSKYDAAKKLQEDGALKNLPYKNKQKQRDIVVQWSTWCDPRISQITGAPPATKDDLRKVVYKQVEEQGPMTPEKKKKVDQGIDTIFGKIELTTAKAKDLEKPQKETPPVAVTTVAETPPAGQPVSAPTAAPGETVAGTPMATPQRPGTTPTEPTATPTPCKDDLLALAKAKDLVDKAVKACTDLDRLDREAGEAEDAADADDATPAGKEAKAKADKAAADAKAAKEIADEADAAKAKDAKAKRKKADAAAEAADAAKSPLRKKADEARKKMIEAVGAKWDAQREARNAIKKLKCPENIDKLTKKLKDACGK